GAWAAVPLRPADALRLERPAAGVGDQPARHRGGRFVFRMMFYLFAAVAVIVSLLVIAQRNPIYSVLLLIASFGALSGLYVLLDAPFVAVIQIIVYAGAIMVLFLFVVMLLNAPHEDTESDLERVGVHHGVHDPSVDTEPVPVRAYDSPGVRRVGVVLRT